MQMLLMWKPWSFLMILYFFEVIAKDRHNRDETKILVENKKDLIIYLKKQEK